MKKLSMRRIAKVAGVTTQTLMNGIRLLEPYVEQLEAQKKAPDRAGP